MRGWGRRGRGFQEAMSKQWAERASLEFTEEQNTKGLADQSRRKRRGDSNSLINLSNISISQ